MKLDIKEVQVYDLDGQLIPYKLGKTIGNVIYMKASSLDWDIVARKIYAEESVELSDEQIEQVEQILLSDETPILLPIKKALKDYFTTLKTQEHVEDSK